MAHSGKMFKGHDVAEEQWLAEGLVDSAKALCRVGEMSQAALSAAKLDPHALEALGELIDGARKVSDRMRYIYISYLELQDTYDEPAEPPTVKEEQNGNTP